MLDLDMIRQNYASLTDQELLHLARTEGHQLTSEAFQILQQELKKRNLDNDAAVASVEENKAVAREKSAQRLNDNFANELAALAAFAMDEKEAGSSDEQIRKELIEKGLTEEEATALLSNMETLATNSLNAAESKFIRGLLFFIIGLVITIYSFSAAGDGGTYVITWGAIVFGGIAIFNGSIGKRKYRKVLANINASKSA